MVYDIFVWSENAKMAYLLCHVGGYLVMTFTLSSSNILVKGTRLDGDEETLLLNLHFVRYLVNRKGGNSQNDEEMDSRYEVHHDQMTMDTFVDEQFGDFEK